MSQKSFDFIIIGAGAAGLQLLLNLLEDDMYSKSKILLLDKDEKKTNDKTWCFWEKGKGPYEDLIHKSWSQGYFHSKKISITLNMGDYTYKMLRSIDFYKHASELIDQSDNVTWLFNEVVAARDNGVVKTSNAEYKADWIFDSRVPVDFKNDTKSTKLLQHFCGWTIKFDEDVFDPEFFTMMDYRDNKPDTTSFTYILPFDRRSALVEFTLFTAGLLNTSEYDTYLQHYIKSRISESSYQIIDTEQGVIPMTDYSFQRHHRGKLIKIGSGGGWVKPSSGYSFKISQSFINKLINNLKYNENPWRGVATGRHRLYDSVFLRILDQHNDKGEQYFETMYRKLPAYRIFNFLDEQSNLIEDIRVMGKYLNVPFTKAFIQQLFRK